MSDQARFSFSALAGPTPTATVEDETTNNPEIQVDAISSSPNSFTPLNRLSPSPDHSSDTGLGQPNTVQSGVTLDLQDTSYAAPQPDISRQLEATTTALSQLWSALFASKPL